MTLEERLCNHFVMSASHNMDASREIADHKIISKAKRDKDRGSNCISFNFRRAKGDMIDQNKFLMPIWNDVPALAFQVVSALEQGIRCSVVGSAEVGKVVGLMKNCFKDYKHRLEFVDEGLDLSLANSIIKGVNTAFYGLELKEDKPFCFVPLDLPFFYDYRDVVSDHDLKTAGCVMDINSKQNIFSDKPEFFPRNYYHTFRDEKGEIHNFKEPNIYGFDSSLDYSIINRFYENRQGGRMNIFSIIKILGKNMLSDYPGSSKAIHHILSIASSTFKKKLGMVDEVIIDREDIEDIGYYVFGKPFVFKAKHKDPFRLRDIDAWHDLWYYRLIFDHLEEKHNSSEDALASVYPYFDKIIELDNSIKKIKSEIGVLNHFRDYACNVYKSLHKLYPVPELRAPLTVKGRHIDGPCYGEDIEQSVIYLENKLREFRCQESHEEISKV